MSLKSLMGTLGILWTSKLKTVIVLLSAIVLAAGCTNSRPSDGEVKVTIPSMYMPNTYTEYYLDPTLDIPPSEAVGWSRKEPSDNDVSSLVKTLGVLSEPTKTASDDGGGWQAGDPSRGVSVNVTQNGSWTAQSPSVSAVPKELQDCFTIDLPDDSSIAAEALEQCVAQAEQQQANYLPPPSYAEAEIQARNYFPNDATFTPGESNEEVTIVNVAYRVADELSISGGYYQVYASPPQGEPKWVAGGYIGEISSLGPMATMSAMETLARIDDYRFGYEVYSESVPYDIPAKVTLTKVRQELTKLYDADGNMLWLPGFVYGDEEGNFWNVVAVDGKYFIEAPAEGSVQKPNDIPEGFLQSLAGLYEQEAIEKISSIGLYARVVSRNGELLPTTKDYRSDRVNLSIENDVVVKSEVY